MNDDVLVLIPYRPDLGHRDRIFTHLKDNYWKHIGFDLAVGENLDGPFNRSAALNRSADREWGFAVIADADTWVPVKQLHQALLTARVTGRLVAAFDAVVELSRTCTDDILSGRLSLAGSFGADRVRTRELETQSSMLVVSRTLWDKTGGFDERFDGWGGEDNAFWKSCLLHGGEPKRVTGNAYHLWHPPAPGKHHGINYMRNRNLWLRYDQARTVEELNTI